MATREDISVDTIFQKAIEGSPNVRSHSDLLVLALHSTLLSYGGYDCISIVEESFDTDQSKSPALSTPTNPALPEGWNSDSEAYKLQYRQRKQIKRTCYVSILPHGDELLIYTSCSDSVTEVNFVILPLNEYVVDESNEGPFVMSNLKNVIKLFLFLKREVAEKVDKPEQYEEERWILPKINHLVSDSSEDED